MAAETVVLALLVSLRLRQHRVLRATAVKQENKKETLVEATSCPSEEPDATTHGGGDHLAVIECLELTPDCKTGLTSFVTFNNKI